jgi:outer membrane receptor protein involved in Fe transport
MPSPRLVLGAAASTLSLLAGQAGAEAVAAVEPPAAAPPAHEVKEVVITAHRLDAARDTIQPETGASTYTIPNSAIQVLPGGDNAAFNEIVLQMPGVAQDSYGQLHVRGDHANVQYRFNGVILPEGLSGFGQVLSPRIANSIELITGALPAEYGLRTAGIINIKTKSGFENGGEVSIYGGSHGEYEPSVEYGGSSGPDSYFVSASYTQDQLGIESVDGSATPRHDRTAEIQGFAYFDHILNEASRVSFIVGSSNQSFQIPDPEGLQPPNGYQVNGQTSYPSARLNQTQNEITDFATASLLETTENFTGQLSLFGRYSGLEYHPDILGELLYNGIAQTATKQDVSVGLQAEGAYTLGLAHTLRAGLVVQDDHSTSATHSLVIGTPLAAEGQNDSLLYVPDNASMSSQTYSVYVQDEWKPFDHLTINYGLRFDQLVSYRRENQLSPRLNAVWTPLRGLTVHGGYARYFTPPPFELVADETLSKFAGTVAYPPAPLGKTPQDTTPYAERDNYFDLGVQQKLTRSLTVGVDSYFRTSKNLIDEGQFGAPIILTPFNYKYGKTHGVELTTSYNKGPLTSYVNLAYSRALGEGIESSQFNFSPAELSYISGHYIFLDHNETWSSSFGAAYHWRDTKVGLDGIYGSGLRATGADLIPNGASLASYTVINVSLQQRLKFLPLGPFDGRFDIVNLFDKKYEIRDGSGVGVGAPQWGARRGFFFGLSKPF